MEQLQTLMGKYGEEGDRLIFKILNNGLYEKKDKAALQQAWDSLLEKPSSNTLITERALRYDLTIPFARYVYCHRRHGNSPSCWCFGGKNHSFATKRRICMLALEKCPMV
jgi:histidyl-tRNA synthetase